MAVDGCQLSCLAWYRWSSALVQQTLPSSPAMTACALADLCR
jgi:hypothetical protein